MPVIDACRRNKKNRPNYAVLNYMFVIPIVFSSTNSKWFPKAKVCFKIHCYLLFFPLAAKEER